MATTFLEPGGDADFGFSLWTSTTGPPTIVSDIVHGGHRRSIRAVPGSVCNAERDNIVADTGARISFAIYLAALPTTSTAPIMLVKGPAGAPTLGDYTRLQVTTGGVLQLRYSGSQIGSNGATLTTGRWYRISIAYTITSTTVNRFEVFVNGASSISVTNATLDAPGGLHVQLGINNNNAAHDTRTSDIYVDDSSALTDPGNLWVTAKRPFANGTTNNFVTQIGAGGSGYGSGHAPQVNERASSDTNGWSVVAAGATTEEYSIEGATVGDIPLTTEALVDVLGWVRAKALVSETGSIVVAGASSNISLTSTITTFIKIAGSTTYPAGNTDIGMITDATATTVSLYECGIVVAYVTDLLMAGSVM